MCISQITSLKRFRKIIIVHYDKSFFFFFFFFFFIIFKPLIFFLFDVDFDKSIIGFHYLYIFFILAKFQNNQIFLFKWVSPLLFCRSFFLSYTTRLLSFRVSYRAAFFFPLFVESTIMADDVSQILEKMKLTLEEEETVTISDEG